MVMFSRCSLSVAVLLAVSLAVGAAPWPGGRGAGYGGAFPDVTFPAKPATVWKAYLGPGFTDASPSNTVVADGNVIVAYGKILVAVSADTGEFRWYKELGEVPVGDLLLLDGQLIIAMPSGSIGAYSPVDGKPIWSRQLAGGLRNGPVYTDNLLFLTTKANTVEGIQRKTGKHVGSSDAQEKIEAAPVLLGSKYLVYCYANGEVKRIELDSGIIRWKINIPNAIVSLTPPTDGQTIVINTTNTLYALNPTNATSPVRWTYLAPMRLHKPVTLDGNRAYFATNNSRLHALDLTTGRDVWSTTSTVTDKGKEVTKTEAGLLLPAPPVDNPLVIGNGLLVRMQSGLIALYDKASGKQVWGYTLKAPLDDFAPKESFAGAPAIVGNDVYFAGTDGHIYHLSSTAPDVEPPTFSGGMPQVTTRGFVQSSAVQYVGAIVEDEGVGLQTDSVTMQLDRTDLTPRMQFDAKSGYYYVQLDAAQPLQPGMHRLVISAADYRGNKGELAMNFIVGDEKTAAAVTVNIGGEFVPKHLKVKPGTVVIWRNTTGSARTVIADSEEFSTDLRLSSDLQYAEGIPNGETWVWIVPADAEYGTKIYYHCRLKGKAGDGEQFGTGLAGVIEVAQPRVETPEHGPAGGGPGGMPGGPGGPGGPPPPMF